MPTMSNSQILALTLAGGFFLLGGIAIFQSLMAIVRGYTSKRWPRTDGTIIESRLEEQVNADGQLLFFPQVRYRYVVQGRKYESTIITFPTRASASRHWVQAVVARYPVSSSVQVSYLLEKPTVSVLEPGLTSSAFIGVSIGLSFLLGSVAGGYFLLARVPY